jgi:hypothetical protein
MVSNPMRDLNLEWELLLRTQVQTDKINGSPT